MRRRRTFTSAAVLLAYAVVTPPSFAAPTSGGALTPRPLTAQFGTAITEAEWQEALKRVEAGTAAAELAGWSVVTTNDLAEGESNLADDRTVSTYDRASNALRYTRFDRSTEIEMLDHDVVEVGRTEWVLLDPAERKVAAYLGKPNATHMHWSDEGLSERVEWSRPSKIHLLPTEGSRLAFVSAASTTNSDGSTSYDWQLRRDGRLYDATMTTAVDSARLISARIVRTTEGDEDDTFRMRSEWQVSISYGPQTVTAPAQSVSSNDFYDARAALRMPSQLRSDAVNIATRANSRALTEGRRVTAAELRSAARAPSLLRRWRGRDVRFQVTDISGGTRIAVRNRLSNGWRTCTVRVVSRAAVVQRCGWAPKA